MRSGLKLRDIPVHSSLSEYREKVSAKFFRNIFEEDFGRYNSSRRTYRGFYIYAIDGDALDLSASQELLAQGFRGVRFKKDKETHCLKMYTTQALDVVNGLISEFSYAEKPGQEIRQAREMVLGLETNSIAIYDRLHCTYRTVLTHFKAGNHFLIRVKDRDPKAQHEIQKFCKSLKRSSWIRLKANNQDLKRENLPELKVRLVKIRNPKTKRDLVVMTDLTTDKFTNKDVGRLYQRRWDIESSFRDLTYTLKMGEWHTTKLNGVLQEIYALLWLVNQVRRQCSCLLEQTSDWLAPKYNKPNFKLLLNLVMEHLELLLRSRTNDLNKILEFWLQRSAESRTRLSRSYPRAIRRVGKQYKMATTVKKRA